MGKKKCIFTIGNLFCIMPYKKPARHLAAYRVEFSLMGAQALAWGTEIAHWESRKPSKYC